MKVLNIHSRQIKGSRKEISKLLETLSSRNDLVWPWEKWPRMKFKEGLKLGAHREHGPVGYTISKLKLAEVIEFIFTKPHGFNGLHRLEIEEIDADSTKLTHTIQMETKGSGTLKWIAGVRVLHDALIEDAFD